MTTQQTVFEVTGVSLAILKSMPPQLSISVTGNCNTSGWNNFVIAPRVYIMPPTDGIWDADLMGDKPDGMVLEVITAMHTDAVWPDIPAGLKGVRINAASNSMVAMQ